MGANDWYRRVYFPSGANASLGWGYEYWILDPTVYKGHDDLKARASALGLRWTKRRLAYELAKNLLEEVLAAAAGVEHSILALRDAIARAQHWSDQNVTTTGPSPVPQSIGHPSVIDAWYEFANLLSWARAVEERLDRDAYQQKGAPALPHQGLIPALKPARLKKRVAKLMAELSSGPISEARFLANFTLHAALIRNPNSGARLDENGKVRPPIPDKQVRRIGNWKLLTWNDHRDGVVLAEELWASIESFIEALIEAFERAVPKRLRKP